MGHNDKNTTYQRHGQWQQEVREQGERHEHVLQGRDFGVQQKRRGRGRVVVVAQSRVHAGPCVAPTTNRLATFPTAAPAVVLKEGVQIHKGVGVPFNVAGLERGRGASET